MMSARLVTVVSWLLVCEVCRPNPYSNNYGTVNDSEDASSYSNSLTSNQNHQHDHHRHHHRRNTAAASGNIDSYERDATFSKDITDFLNQSLNPSFPFEELISFPPNQVFSYPLDHPLAYQFDFGEVDFDTSTDNNASSSRLKREGKRRRKTTTTTPSPLPPNPSNTYFLDVPDAPRRKLRLGQGRGKLNKETLESSRRERDRERLSKELGVPLGFEHIPTRSCPSTIEFQKINTALDKNNGVVQIYQPEAGPLPGLEKFTQVFFTETCANQALARQCTNCCRGVDHRKFSSQCQQGKALVGALVRKPGDIAYYWSHIQVNSSCSCLFKPRLRQDL